jgi:ribonuclease BN (tRNA processing enzyme)
LRVKVLGAHKLESKHARHTCFLIDDVLALDAGSLSSSLTIEEQARIKAILLTHCHHDHIRDIPTLGLSTLQDGNTIELWSQPETLMAIHEHLLNGRIHPDLTTPIGALLAKFSLRPLGVEGTISLMTYQVKPVCMSHTVPCTGFIVKAQDGGCVAYTGDTRGGLHPYFKDSLKPQVLFVDVSFPNRLTELADLTGHLTPDGLGDELGTALSWGIRLPQVVPVHISYEYEQEITDELLCIGSKLGIDLVPGKEDRQLICLPDVFD